MDVRLPACIQLWHCLIKELWSFMLHREKTDRFRHCCSQLGIGLPDRRGGIMSPFLYSLPRSQLQICSWLRPRRQVGGWHHGYQHSSVDGDESAMQAGGGPPGLAVARRTTCCSGLLSASFFSPTTQTILNNDGLRHFQKNFEITRPPIQEVSDSWIPPG